MFRSYQFSITKVVQAFASLWRRCVRRSVTAQFELDTWVSTSTHPHYVGRVTHKTFRYGSWCYQLDVSLPTDRSISLVYIPEYELSMIETFQLAKTARARIRAARECCYDAMKPCDDYLERMDTVARKLRQLLEMPTMSQCPALCILIGRMHVVASNLISFRDNNQFSQLCGLFDQCLLILQSRDEQSSVSLA